VDRPQRLASLNDAEGVVNKTYKKKKLSESAAQKAVECITSTTARVGTRRAVTGYYPSPHEDLGGIPRKLLATMPRTGRYLEVFANEPLAPIPGSSSSTFMFGNGGLNGTPLKFEHLNSSSLNSFGSTPHSNSIYTSNYHYNNSNIYNHNSLYASSPVTMSPSTHNLMPSSSPTTESQPFNNYTSPLPSFTSMHSPGPLPVNSPPGSPLATTSSTGFSFPTPSSTLHDTGSPGKGIGSSSPGGSLILVTIITFNLLMSLIMKYIYLIIRFTNYCFLYVILGIIMNQPFNNTIYF
jgi:hypothetical protein